MTDQFTYELRQTLLQVTDVSLTLGGVPVLRDLNFTVKNIYRPGMHQGQVVGLLGPSGMGKTCLFRVLAGMEAPDRGSVLLADDQPVHRGMVGMVAQDYPLFAHRTVLSNVVVAGCCAGLSTAESQEKAQGLLQRFGMESHQHKYPAQLSGGQRQRVAIAQQFMCSDHYLLMDEPFSGLDPIAIARVCDFIKEIAAQDELDTFIVITHDINAALEICDTICLLGRDRDEHDNIIPGARIQKTYNLMDCGIAWREHPTLLPECIEMQKEIRTVFPKL